MSRKGTPTDSRTAVEERRAARGGTQTDAEAPLAEFRDERDRIDPAELREEHQQRQQEQQAHIEDVDNETLLKMLYQMVLIRRFEEKAAEAYTLGKIGGFCHLYIGQEAVAVGCLSALRTDDYVLTSYRDHGHALVMGTSADEVMAELYGRIGGCSKGKGGSMHLFDADKHFLGGHGIVGGQIPLATGVAFATKYKGTDQATLVFFGEAAVNQGAFHESLNMAQLWKLPCVYICENNQYGMGTSLKRAMSISDVSQKAVGYGMAAEFVDGMDVLAVRAATERALERARAEYLPSLLEIRTYRFMGHSMSDPGHYRTRAEIERYQERDPIKVFGDNLREKGVLDAAGLREIEDRVRYEVERSVKFADESPEPPPEELYTNVYATPIGRLGHAGKAKDKEEGGLRDSLPKRQYRLRIGNSSDLTSILSLLGSGLVRVNDAIAFVEADPILADNQILHLQAVLYEAFKLFSQDRSLHDGLGEIISATIHAIENRQGVLTLSQLAAIRHALRRATDDPFLKYEDALDQTMELEATGLDCEPEMFDKLTEALLGFK